MSEAIKEARLLMEMPTIAPANEHRRIIKNLLTELSQYQKVVDEADKFINTNVSDWKAQDAAYGAYNEALSQLKK